MSAPASLRTSFSSSGAGGPSEAGTSTVTDYPAEARFAVVMYGGVSLAIYINGVAQELLHMVKATARDGSLLPMIAENKLTKTERVYRKVSYLLGGADLEGAKERLESNAVIPTRFIIDIISGTSAGGINGIFLAKALTNGQSIDALQELWIKEGDLALLINDQQSVEKPLALNKPPASLLNSQRMYLKLLEAFDGMETTGPRAAGGPAYVDELDLYVTTTDIQGVSLPIRLADEIVYERRHRNVLHFVYSKAEVSGEKADRNDFEAQYNPFLAYASRCTSAFPFAFEPMCLCDTDDVLGRMEKYAGNGNYKSDSALWQRFYQDYLNPQGVAAVAFPRRAFGDGGYLDNKPFTYATETLARRHADVPVDRKLIYVEPSPEHPENIRDTDRRPNALENSMAALMSLPRYETIREDIARVIQRNWMIERINRIIRGFERDLDQVESQEQQGKKTGAFWLPRNSDELWAKADLTDDEWSQLDLADMVKRKGRGYVGYHRLQIGSVTDDLAKLVARVAGFGEESDYFHVTRSLVRAWRDKHYVEYRQGPNDRRPTMNGFLHSFDLTYSIRRLNFLRSRIDRFYQLDEEARAVMNLRVKDFWAGDAAADARKEHEFRAELRSIKGKLNGVYVSLRSTGRTLRSRQDPHQAAEKATPASPLHAKIQELIAEIGKALAKARPQAAQSIAQDKAAEPGSLILEYLLDAQGKVATPSSGDNAGPRDAGRLQAECDKRARKFLVDNENVAAAFADLGVLIEQQIRPAVEDADKTCKSLFLLPNTSPDFPPGAIDARSCLAHYYQRYDEYDMIIFPILYDTNVGEADEVEIIRVSPEDGRALIDERKSGCHKLAGTYLANFGGFLEKLWRKNDIFWGRLDGAERIIRALLGNDPRADALIGEAHAAIVCETIEHIGDKEMKDLLVESLMRPKNGKADADTLGRFITNLKDHAGDPKLRKTLDDRINAGEIRDHYQEVFETHSGLQPTQALRTVARATTVVGNMLSDIAAQRNLKTKYIGWIAKLGEVFWGLVEVAVPRSMANLIFHYWLKLLYLFEAVVLVGGVLLANKEVQQFALTAFAITLSTHLAVRVLQDYLQYRYTWLNRVKVTSVIVFLTLIVLGALSIAAATGMAEPFWHALVWVRTRFTAPPA